MRAIDLVSALVVRTEAIGVCLFCDEYDNVLSVTLACGLAWVACSIAMHH